MKAAFEKVIAHIKNFYLSYPQPVRRWTLGALTMLWVLLPLLLVHQTTKYTLSLQLGSTAIIALGLAIVGLSQWLKKNHQIRIARRNKNKNVACPKTTSSKANTTASTVLDG